MPPLLYLPGQEDSSLADRKMILIPMNIVNPPMEESYLFQVN